MQPLLNHLPSEILQIVFIAKKCLTDKMKHYNINKECQLSDCYICTKNKIINNNCIRLTFAFVLLHDM